MNLHYFNLIKIKRCRLNNGWTTMMPCHMTIMIMTTMTIIVHGTFFTIIYLSVHDNLYLRLSKTVYANRYNWKWWSFLFSRRIFLLRHLFWSHCYQSLGRCIFQRYSLETEMLLGILFITRRSSFRWSCLLPFLQTFVYSVVEWLHFKWATRDIVTTRTNIRIVDPN